MRVLIIGAGIGGLCLAHGLRKAGIEVQIFERQKTPSDDLAGYGIHIDRNGRRALQKCIPEASWTRFQTESVSAGTKIFFRDENLRCLAEKDEAEILKCGVEEVERRGIGRVALRNILLEGLIEGDLPVVHFGKIFMHYSRLEEGGVRAHFADGTTQDGDVLVGADGARSAVRQQRLPHVRREELGITAIAGRCGVSSQNEKTLPTSISDGSLNNIVPSGKGWMFVSSWNLPTVSVATTAECERQMVWAYVVPSMDNAGITPTSSHCELKEFVLRGTQSWASGLQEVVRSSDASTVTRIPLRSMESLEPWSASNVTLLGDAIHSMTPMAGVGANTALRDSELLSDVLAQVVSGHLGLVDAVGRYESAMRAYANGAVQLSRRNAVAASSGQGVKRRMFRLLLKAAQTSPLIMRHTLGRPPQHKVEVA